MFLVLNIKDNNSAEWFLTEDSSVKDSLEFVIDRTNDKTFESLDKLLSNNSLKLKDVLGIALSIKDASLTQVKVFTAIINTLAWQLGISAIGKYYYKESFDSVLKDIFKEIKGSNQKIISAEYNQDPDISRSKKVRKYVIKK